MSKEEKLIRQEMEFQLTRGNAHMPIEEIVKDFPSSHYNAVFPNGKYTFWGVLEHIRRVQADILDFIINSKYKEPHFPDDYWPKKNEKATKVKWEKTIKQFLKDRGKLQKMIKDPKVDIFKKIPWGSGQTFMREIFVVSDHNSYELGEFAIMRQVLGVWGKYH